MNSCCNKLCRHWLPQDNIYGLNAIEIALLPEEVFLCSIVLSVVDNEVHALEIPARERARAFADVGLLVVANAHGEEFHDFAREVLVWCTFYVHACV